MTDSDARPYTAFRLNFEQQRNRAKDLLRAARAGEPVALRRLQDIGSAGSSAPKLAAAQHCIARELRFASWADLKRHIAAMEQSRVSLGTRVDGDYRTMHIRCGHDIGTALREAGLYGDFNAHTNPYQQGPVTDTSDWLEERARFIADSLGPYLDVDYSSVLEGCRREEELLAAASRGYERVALWFEHDRYDQFALLRCLAAFAENGAPPRLELVGTNDFPGAARFVGLGQLPPEALRLLWKRRVPLTTKQIAYGERAWRMFRAADPTALAALARAGTPPLPDLAGALDRHLRELPSLANGLGYTHELLLRTLAEHEPLRAGKLVGLAMQRDRLPGLGDIGYDLVLRELEAGAAPLVRRASGHPAAAWHRDEIEITEAGRATLAGEQDWLDLGVRERWVAGVRITPGERNYRWDERALDVVWR